jgi:hypothetical protein
VPIRMVTEPITCGYSGLTLSRFQRRNSDRRGSCHPAVLRKSRLLRNVPTRDKRTPDKKRRVSVSCISSCPSKRRVCQEPGHSRPAVAVRHAVCNFRQLFGVRRSCIVVPG